MGSQDVRKGSEIPARSVSKAAARHRHDPVVRLRFVTEIQARTRCAVRHITILVVASLCVATLESKAVTCVRGARMFGGATNGSGPNVGEFPTWLAALPP
jgi:hypothetical protein